MADDYADLKAARRFRLEVHAEGFVAREVIGVGEGLYDVMLAGLEPDGSILFTDIGGQELPEFDPEKGHGALLRLTRDDKVQPIVPAKNIQRFVPMNLFRAPQHFGSWGDHIFLVAQTWPGRPGANKPHGIIRVAPDADIPELFAIMPNAGTINDGIPGASLTGGFAPEGSPFGPSLFAHSMKNCTIYRFSPEGEAEVFINFDRAEGPIMPYALKFAPKWWGDLADELVMLAAVGADFNSGRPPAEAWKTFRVLPDRTIEPLEKVPYPMYGVMAPAEFGPYGGHVFYVDEGPIDLGIEEGCDEFPGLSLPYKARLMRQAPDGGVHVFADEFWGSYTTPVFDGPRLVLGLVGKSYSTGEFHEPDAAIYEITYTG
jgi:hypothetical protein